MTWTRTRIVTTASIVGAVVAFAIVAWSRRWIADDGLIYVRVVRNILDGNGPTFNAFERTEANTSALWPWLLALVGVVKSGDQAPVAVYTGLVCSVAGFALAIDGTRRWHRARGSTAMLVPGSLLVVLGVYPFWDYATSGLETGLTTLWIASAWWLLVGLDRTTTRRRQLASVIVFGLGPLVRPDLGLATVVFLVAAWAILRPPRRRTLLLAGTAIAIPLLYEIFRAGYYGMLVPLPALAKSATHAEWGRGWWYLRDFAAPYLLWLPLAVLVGLFGYVAARRPGSRARRILGRDRIVFAAPVISAVLLALYVLRVGGDFMHGRMLLPVTFLIILPGLVLPLRRFTAVPLAILAGWALVIGVRLNDHQAHVSSPFVGDERAGYVFWTGRAHPIHSADHIRPAYPGVGDFFAALAAHARPFMTEGGGHYAIAPHLDANSVYAVGRLGMGGAATPLDGIAADMLGLANPIGARITITRPDEGPGHQKPLPDEWLLADFADPAHDGESGKPPLRIAAARNAMTCGALRELLASVREPLTPSRFWANLTGAIGRTRLVIPADAVDAEEKFCGTSSFATITASSSCELYGWGAAYAMDGNLHTVIGGTLGYSSQLWVDHDHTEWLELAFRAPQTLRGVTLYPRDDANSVGAGFPIDFTIQVWDGTTWIDRVTRTDTPRPAAPQTYAFDPPVTTTRVRIQATRLQNVADAGYVMELAEIAVIR